MSDPKRDSETYSEAETDARAAAVLKRMLSTPPKPHKAMKKGVRAKTVTD